MARTREGQQGLGSAFAVSAFSQWGASSIILVFNFLQLTVCASSRGCVWVCVDACMCVRARASVSIRHAVCARVRVGSMCVCVL